MKLNEESDRNNKLERSSSIRRENNRTIVKREINNRKSNSPHLYAFIETKLKATSYQNELKLCGIGIPRIYSENNLS
ncbi:Hypothetical predicted protein [Octopus vulgaris]|uniref:Uncharacterized protein n=1 Tax=Octopus vulgaris TaxID=6645 RepID=A0AA36ALZ4_OCTVU|nr:Hypothetical predicted protein [Octopus vulgaris]